jgi:hypothetical protein
LAGSSPAEAVERLHGDQGGLSESDQPRYLLILACSQRKRPDPGLLPAIERYDGVNFRVLKKARREGYWPSGLRVLILSAKYGLLEADEPIENYNLRMTRDIAGRLRDSIGIRLDEVLCETNWQNIFVNLGGDYLPAIASASELTRFGDTVVYASGGIGTRMAHLRQWLLTI